MEIIRGGDMMHQVRQLLDALGAGTHDDNVQVAMDVLDRFGSYRNAMLEASKIDFKKKDELLFALLEEVELDYTADVKRISALMHTINRTAVVESEKTGNDYYKLLSNIDIKKTFGLSDMDVFVLNAVGGRKVIMKVNRYEPNQLCRLIEKQVIRFKCRPEEPSDTLIDNRVMGLISNSHWKEEV